MAMQELQLYIPVIFPTAIIKVLEVALKETLLAYNNKYCILSKIGHKITPKWGLETKGLIYLYDKNFTEYVST